MRNIEFGGKTVSADGQRAVDREIGLIVATLTFAFISVYSCLFPFVTKFFLLVVLAAFPCSGFACIAVVFTRM
jgi:hypothetical protein